MKEIIEKINHILATWNPIGVDSNIALDEYKGYIPLIIKNIDDNEKLKKCLENILIGEIGVEYDPTNENHARDLRQICDRINRVYNHA